MPDPYNTMQESAGMLPLSYTPPSNPLVFPGMVSSAMQIGGQGGFGAGVFPTQQWQTFTNQPTMTQGPTGIMMPGMPSAPYNPYAPMGLGSMNPIAQGLYGPGTPMPPPAYAGPQGRASPFFGPRPPTPQFDNPFQAFQSQETATQERLFRGTVSSYGAAARVAADFAAAGIGAAIGSRFGSAKLGAAAGFAASEMSGFSGGVQNVAMDYGLSPAINMRAYGAGIEHISRGFMAGGDFGHVSGSGMSHAASIRTARLLDDVVSSPRFQADTQDRFNRADVMKIAQLGGREGLLDGASNPEQMASRVRDLAKSLSSFMELANEPDVQRAIQTMGQMRSSGLNYGETLRAVSNGRAWARMAGTTFEQLSSTGGALGSQTYGAMGLSQGLGFQAGMGNYALARNAQMSGVVSPQMMSLMGGAEGAAGLSNMFSGSFLQQPMLAPGVMNGMGGLDEGRVRQLLSGRTDLFSLTGNAVGALNGMTRGMGVEGLGLAIASQPLIQDSLGRIMESQGPFARRNTEDLQVLSTMRRFGHTGSAGFSTMAQAMGMSGTQALSRVRELGSSDYYNAQRDQIEVVRRERRASELRDIEAMRPGMVQDLEYESPAFAAMTRGARNARHGIQNFYEDIAHGMPYAGSSYTTSDARDRYERFARSTRGLDSLRTTANSPRESASWGTRFNTDRALYGASGVTGYLADIGSAFSATFGDDRVRQGEVRSLQQLSRWGQNITQTSAPEAMAAQRMMNRNGVTDATISGIGSAFAGLGMGPNSALGGAFGAGVANSLVRGGSMFLTGGQIDPGNIAGARVVSTEQIRSAVIQQLRGQGWDAARAGSFANSNMTAIQQAASPYATSLMDRDSLVRWNDAIQVGQRVSAGGGVNAEESGRRAYEGVLGAGAGNVRERRALDVIADGAQGVGRGAVADKSRRALAVIRSLQTQLQHGGSQEQKTSAQRRIEEVRNELFRTSGMTQEEKNAFMAQMLITNNASLDNMDARQMGAHMMATGGTGAQLLQRYTNTEDARASDMYRRRFETGVRSLGNEGGSMGQLFHGVTDESSLQSNISSLAGNEAFMAGLNEQQREVVSRANRGDRGALAEVANWAQTRGRTGENARARYLHSAYARWRSGDQSVFDSEEDYVAKEMARGTNADRNASRSDAGVDATQSAAAGQSIGAVTDQLAEVTRNLDRVTHNLASVTEAGRIDNLLGRRPE